MKPDIFQYRKCVHIKLDKDVHAALRTKLFQHQLTMQDFFDEFATMYVNDDRRVVKMVEQLVSLKVQRAIEGIVKPREKRISELDQNSLYDVISGKGTPGEDDDNEAG